MSEEKAKYQILANSIFEKVRSGELARGAFLPCERDLANIYGFSRITVRSGLKKLVEENVIESVERKGYRVIEIPYQPMARTHNIGGLWCSGVHSEHTYNLFAAAEEIAAKRKYALFLNDSGDDDLNQAIKISAMLEHNTDGLMIVPTYSSANDLMTLGNHKLILALRRSGIPLVMIDRPFPETDLPCVVNDDEAGGRLAADYFIGGKHKKVMILGADHHYYIPHLRLGAFSRRCEESGVKVFPFFWPYKDADNKINNFHAQYKKYREEIIRQITRHKITAVMICLGEVGRQIIADLEHLNLSFALYDCTGAYVSAKCPAAVIIRPIRTIASRAMELLMAEIETGAKQEPAQIKIAPELHEIPVLQL